MDHQGGVSLSVKASSLLKEQSSITSAIRDEILPKFQRVADAVSLLPNEQSDAIATLQRKQQELMSALEDMRLQSSHIKDISESHRLKQTASLQTVVREKEQLVARLASCLHLIERMCSTKLNAEAQQLRVSLPGMSQNALGPKDFGTTLSPNDVEANWAAISEAVGAFR